MTDSTDRTTDSACASRAGSVLAGVFVGWVSVAVLACIVGEPLAREVDTVHKANQALKTTIRAYGEYLNASQADALQWRAELMACKGEVDG